MKLIQFCMSIFTSIQSRMSSDLQQVRTILSNAHNIKNENRDKIINMYKYQLVTKGEDFFTNAPWIFNSEAIIDLSASDVFNILIDDDAWQHWLSAVTNIEWIGTNRELNSERTIVYKDPLFSLLLGGHLKIHEKIDIYEKDKAFGLSFVALNRPTFLTYKSIRERFTIDVISKDQCKLTRILAIDPGFVLRYILGCILFPLVTSSFAKTIPIGMQNAIADGKLPLNKQQTSSVEK